MNRWQCRHRDPGRQRLIVPTSSPAASDGAKTARIMPVRYSDALTIQPSRTAGPRSFDRPIGYRSTAEYPTLGHRPCRISGRRQSAANYAYRVPASVRRTGFRPKACRPVVIEAPPRHLRPENPTAHGKSHSLRTCGRLVNNFALSTAGGLASGRKTPRQPAGHAFLGSAKRPFLVSVRISGKLRALARTLPINSAWLSCARLRCPVDRNGSGKD